MAKLVFIHKTNNKAIQNYYFLLFDMHYPFWFLQLTSIFHGNGYFNEKSINIEFLLEQDILPSPEVDRKINNIWFVTSKILPYYLSGMQVICCNEMIKWKIRLKGRLGPYHDILPYCD